MKGQLLAGFGEADITPEGSVVELNGQYYQRIAEGVHSRLKTCALAMEKDKHCFLMITLDVAGVPGDFCENIKQRVSREIPGIKSGDIMINATHTHNAPGSLFGGRKWWERDKEAITAGEFRSFAVEKILEAVKEAYNNRKTAGAGRYAAYCSVGHPRRAVYSDGTAEMYGDTGREDFAGMEGGEDSAVELMYFFDAKKAPLGVVVNVACPSQVMEATRVISSDYMGAVRAKLKKAFGEKFITICQISAAGCQSPRDFTRNKDEIACFWREEGVEIIASRLVEAVEEGFRSSGKNVDFEPVLRGESRKLKLPRRVVNYRDCSRAKRELHRLVNTKDSETAYREFCGELLSNEKNPERLPPYDSKLHHFVLIKEQEAIIRRYEEQFEEPSVVIDVHCLRIGNAVIATNPFELFLSYGQMIKTRSKAEQTFVVQLANGSESYLPAETAELHGGYGALVMNGRVGSDGGSKLVDETVAIINSLFEGSKP